MGYGLRVFPPMLELFAIAIAIAHHLSPIAYCRSPIAHCLEPIACFPPD